MNLIRSSYLIVLSLALAGVGCGNDLAATDPTDSQPPPEKWENIKPVLNIASPGELAVGEKMTMLGEQFIDSKHGKVYLQFKGTFFDSNGQSNTVDLQAEASVHSSGKLTWSMWPNVVFSSTGDRLGQFVGQIQVLNHGIDGSQQISDPLAISISIKPSVIPLVVQAVDFGCAPVAPGSVENTPMQFVAQVVGLREPTEDAPLKFYWGFMNEQWTISYDYGLVDPSSIVDKQGPLLIEDTVTTGQLSSLSDGGTRNVLLKLKDDILGNTRLKTLKTGKIPENGASMLATVNVTAEDASGKSASLAIPINIYPRAELQYDKSTKIAERFEPQRVSDCIPGGDIGREVSYHEATHESKARSMGYNWNANLSVELRPLGMLTKVVASNPMLADPMTWVLGINFSAGFGVNVSEQVSSDQSKSLAINGQILPQLYGAFYRQTTKLYRVGTLIGYTECGASIDLGEAILTDWIFTPDLATANSCPPPTALQPAQKFAN